MYGVDLTLEEESSCERNTIKWFKEFYEDKLIVLCFCGIDPSWDHPVFLEGLEEVGGVQTRGPLSKKNKGGHKAWLTSYSSLPLLVAGSLDHALAFFVFGATHRHGPARYWLSSPSCP